MEFVELAALIRMSHKYHVEEVHSRSMHHLKLYFTNDLTTWDDAGADGNLFQHITPPDAIADAPGGPRLPYPDGSRPPPDSRKRSRGEMEREGESPGAADAGLLAPTAGGRPAGAAPVAPAAPVADERDRGSKRVHPDSLNSENPGRPTSVEKEDEEPMDAD